MTEVQTVLSMYGVLCCKKSRIAVRFAVKISLLSIAVLKNIV